MQKFSYFLNVILAIGLFLVVFKYDCKKAPVEIVTEEQIDSNAFYDEIENMDKSKQLRLYDSIEILNKRITAPKKIFIIKYKQILKDSLVTDSNCLITLYYANETINQMDSLINIQSRGLDACNSQVNNLRNQVNLNKGYAEKLLLYNIELTNENEKLDRKVKRNRLFAGIVSAMLFSFVLIK